MRIGCACAFSRVSFKFILHWRTVVSIHERKSWPVAWRGDVSSSPTGRLRGNVSLWHCGLAVCQLELIPDSYTDVNFVGWPVKHPNMHWYQYCAIRWKIAWSRAAQVARKDLTSDYTRNLWRGNFSKIIGFFKVENTSVLLQQGDLGGNVSTSLYFSKFSNLISYKHVYTDVVFVGWPVKHPNILWCWYCHYEMADTCGYSCASS
jgi:hypothetical protein